MYRIYFKQAWKLLKENKLLTGVSILGTSLAICMIMVIVIVWQIRTANYSPEDHRDRMLYISFATANGIENPQINNCSQLSSHVVKECFLLSTKAEAVGMANHNYEVLLSLPDKTIELKADVCYTDAGFWRVFNFHFLSGKPYMNEAVESGIKEAVVSASVARRLYGTTEVEGKRIELNYVSYTIRGVVSDVSVLAESAYGDIWVPYTSNSTLWDNDSDRLLGSYQCFVLAPSVSDMPAIKEELLANVDRMNLSQTEYRLRLGGAPDTILEKIVRENGMNEPRLVWAVMRYLLIVAIILLVPAINMSGLTLSGMRKRMAELGVRRAFGATRTELIWQVLCQNLLQTLLGGVLGMALSYVAVIFLSGWLLSGAQGGISETFLNAEMLFNPLIFFMSFSICLLLNLLSAGIPAWRGSRLPIVEALNEH